MDADRGVREGLLWISFDLFVQIDKAYLAAVCNITVLKPVRMDVLNNQILVRIAHPDLPLTTEDPPPLYLCTFTEEYEEGSSSRRHPLLPPEVTVEWTLETAAGQRLIDA